MSIVTTTFGNGETAILDDDQISTIIEQTRAVFYELRKRAWNPERFAYDGFPLLAALEDSFIAHGLIEPDTE